MKLPRILYFINGIAPSEKDLAEAEKIQGVVSFRNAKHVSEDSGVETCDGVAGAAPASYSSFPTAQEAVQAYVASVDSLRNKVGDSKAPKKGSIDSGVFVPGKV